MLRSISQRKAVRHLAARPSQHLQLQTNVNVTLSDANTSNHQDRRASSRCVKEYSSSSIVPANLATHNHSRLSHYCEVSNSRHLNHQHTTRRNKSIYVSKHNQSLNVTAKDVIDFHDQNHLPSEVRVSPTHILVKECPFCSKPTKGLASNQYKMYVQLGSGAYFCHRCGTSGSWYDYKSRIQQHDMAPVGIDSLFSANNDATSGSNVMATKNTSIPCLPMPPARIGALNSSRLLSGANDGPNPVLDYLQEVRHLDIKTLRKYGVGRATYNFLNDDNKYVPSECVTFSWIMKEKEVKVQEELRGANYNIENKEQEEDYITRRLKARSIENKAWQRLDPSGGGWGLFGWHTVPEGAKEIIITEGEYDAMAVWQATGRPAVSLPNGCRSLPTEVLPLLEEFSKIYLWMDNDGPGQEGAALFAKKIGMGRCYIVRPTEKNCGPNKPEYLPKDANEALICGLDLDEMIKTATRIPHERILTFDDLQDEILHELLHPEKYVGTPMSSLPAFTETIKGFRRGEMTVLTGPTGSGKTTFLGQLSVDLAEQNVNCLWGSFEIKNTRLIPKLMQQYSRKPLMNSSTTEADLKLLFERFRDLPLYFMKFHGGSDVDEVLHAMDYAVYVNDVEHIILDNLQFMISRRQLKNSSFDKFDVQDLAIEKFRQFATDKNVHVTLVVHPRKEAEDQSLSMSSFYGSAKATQEADTVIILQQDARNNHKFIDVKKNRFDGTLGRVPIYFERESCRYTNDKIKQAGGDNMSFHDDESNQSAPSKMSVNKSRFNGPGYSAY